YSKILKDNVQGITNLSIRRLARRGGVKRTSNDVYPAARTEMKQYLESVLKDIVVVLEHSQRKTVTTNDVVFVLNKRGRTVTGFSE
ncbi:hypothetical protein CERZMDRAFT_48251, partial [Cercospora zeae-maydis SCOH1-5]